MSGLWPQALWIVKDQLTDVDCANMFFLGVRGWAKEAQKWSGSPHQMGLVYSYKPQGVLSTDLTRGSGMMYYNTPFMGVLSNNVHCVSILPCPGVYGEMCAGHGINKIPAY